MTNSMRDELIMKWREAKANLDVAKEIESELRKQVIDCCYSDMAVDVEGVQNIDLGAGFKLKTTFKLNRKLNNDENAVGEALRAMENFSDEGRFLAPRLVKWEPKLSTAEYKKLSPELKAIIDPVITSKPATPSVSLVGPKQK